MPHLSPSELYILEKLGNEPLPTANVVETTEDFSSPTLYTALRSLVKKNIITKVGTMVLLNIIWIEKEIIKLQKLANNHTKIEDKKVRHTRSKKFPTSLATGEKVHYKFKTFAELDTFWMTVPLSIMITKVATNERRWLVWEPIPFWYLYNEKDFLHTVRAVTKYSRELLYACLPFENPSGKKMIPWAQKHSIRSSIISDCKLKQDEYISVHGPFVITTRLGNLHNKVLGLFRSDKEVDRKVLQGLLLGDYELTLTIEHNQKKASEFQKTFGKYFIEKR